MMTASIADWLIAGGLEPDEADRKADEILLRAATFDEIATEIAVEIASALSKRGQLH
jgi:hypothetical protein